MKQRAISLFLSILMLLGLLAGCGQKQADSAGSETPANVATAADMTEVVDVVPEGAQPLYAESLLPGVYDIAVDCSSSMFRIDRCTLTVEDGAITAAITMASESYLYIYPGTAVEAASADEADCIAPVVNADGTRTFLLPVAALDAGVPCAAYSRNKELWYDRTLCFRADSLPLEAFAEGVLTTPESLNLADGSYTVAATLSGGSGKASIASPAQLTVADGVCTLRVEWSSPNYDYMKVGEQQYLPVNTEGNSVFEIPVTVFDRPMAVIADTTAMSEPHEIAYGITLDSATIQ